MTDTVDPLSENKEMSNQKTINQANQLILQRNPPTIEYRVGGVKKFGDERRYLIPKLGIMYPRTGSNSNIEASIQRISPTKWNDFKTLKYENGEFTTCTDIIGNTDSEFVFDIFGLGKASIFYNAMINQQCTLSLVQIMKICSKFDFRIDGENVVFHCPTARTLLNTELVTAQSIILLHIIACAKQS